MSIIIYKDIERMLELLPSTYNKEDQEILNRIIERLIKEREAREVPLGQIEMMINKIKGEEDE